MRIVIDATTLCADFMLKGASMRAFMAGFQRAGHTLFVPQLVLDEATNKHLEFLQTMQSEVAKALSQCQRLAGVTLKSPVTETFIEDAMSSRAKAVADALKGVDAAVLPYPRSEHDIVLKRALSHRHPFTEKERYGSGYRDALNWLVVLELARQPGEPIALISNDGDFYEQGNILGSHLAKELEALGLPKDFVTMYRTLEKFASEMVTPELPPLQVSVSDSAELGEGVRVEAPGSAPTFLNINTSDNRFVAARAVLTWILVSDSFRTFGHIIMPEYPWSEADILDTHFTNADGSTRIHHTQLLPGGEHYMQMVHDVSFYFESSSEHQLAHRQFKKRLTILHAITFNSKLNTVTSSEVTSIILDGLTVDIDPPFRDALRS